MRRIAILVAVLAVAFYGVWPAISVYQILLALQRADGDLLARKVDLAGIAASLTPLALPADATTAQLERALAALARPSALIDLYEQSQRRTDPLGDIVAGIVRAAPAGQLLPSAGAVSAPRSSTGTAPSAAAKAASPFRTLSDSEAEHKAQRRQQQAPAASPVRTLSTTEAEQRAERAAAHTRPQASPVRTLSPDEAEARQKGRRAESPAAAPASAPVEAGRPAAHALAFANLRGIAPRGPLTIAVGLARDAASASPELTAELAFRGFDWKLVALRP